ncbi:hypothetical protein D3C75_927760 [compost metagenome]
MYKPTVVAGRIIEVHADRVLTQQGEMLCTYHPRYYKLPEAELWTHDPEEEPEPGLGQARGIQMPKRRWNPMRPWFTLQKKSANRI